MPAIWVRYSSLGQFARFKLSAGQADVLMVSAPKTSFPSAAQAAASGFSYVARQPILTVDEKVYGYELLFRDGIENQFRETDADSASRRTLDTSLQMGLELLCDSRRGFVNCTREVLLKDYMTLLPPTLAVVEVLESVPADDLVVAALKRLKQAGYMVALDDFVFNDPREALIEFTDIIKVDIQQTTPEQCTEMMVKYGSWLRHLLAEKVETREEFAATKKAGFRYFQGYFFRRPEVMQAKEIPASRVNYLRLLRAVSQPELNHSEFESMIKQEVSICYRLLRYLNSAAFGIQNEVRSVRHALALLGEREVRRWVRLVATLAIGEDRSSELVTTAMVRARFCELLAPRVPHGESDLFLMGMLSMVDAILEIPMSAVLESIPLDQETKSLLLGAPSNLRPLYDLMLARESGDWTNTAECSRKLGLSESEVAEAFWQAMQWARQVSAG